MRKKLHAPFYNGSNILEGWEACLERDEKLKKGKEDEYASHRFGLHEKPADFTR